MTPPFSNYYLGSFLLKLSLKNNEEKIGSTSLCQQEGKVGKQAKTIPLDT